MTVAERGMDIGVAGLGPPGTRSGEACAKLLYVGDVAPLQTVAGSLLLYRLFEGYPTDRLRVVAPTAGPSDGLPGVPMSDLRLVWRRLLTTRLESIAAWLAIQRSRLPVATVERAIQHARPDVIVTLLHDVAWLAAWHAAERHGIPLAVMVHDDRLTFCDRIRGKRKAWAQGWIRRAYRGAAVRFCISPEMRDAYRERFGVDAEVLGPCLPRDAELPEGAVVRRGDAGGPLCFLYAGSVQSEGVKRQLALLAKVLSGRRQELVILGHGTDALRADGRFLMPGVEVLGRVTREAFLETLIARADVLAVGVDSHVGSNAHLLFPSKIADYTALGLPILMFSPHGTAAANWAAGPPQRALLVNDPVGESEVEAAVGRLATDAALREALGAAALQEARGRFSHEAVERIFLKGLAKAIGRD